MPRITSGDRSKIKNMEIKNKNLTLHYGATQFTYWAASSGAASFATTHLLSKGIPSGSVGLLLAMAVLLSCITQPFLATIADNSRKFVLTKMLLIMSVLCFACFSIQLLPLLPLPSAGIFYMMGIWSSDAMVPLLNALNVAYNQADYSINYGAARGVGSAATAVSSLLLGFIIAQLGITWMLMFLLGFRILSIIVILGYPKIEKKVSSTANMGKNCSIVYFFSRYKWYCISLLGILFLGMYHAMTENYMITIMERLGGDSSNVGIALFISAMVASPIIFFFSKVRKHIRDTRLLKIAALSFLVKAILFYFAESITAIYLLQLIQITSYAFLAPTQVYYANAKVQRSDMVKGQAFITAAYALGCSAGNFAGGQLLVFGVDAILISGIMMALAGTVIIFLTVNKTDFQPEQY